MIHQYSTSYMVPIDSLANNLLVISSEMLLDWNFESYKGITEDEFWETSKCGSAVTGKINKLKKLYLIILILNI